jgi:predicted O-methyltransferase YrrM
MDTHNYITKKYRIDITQHSPINVGISRNGLAQLFSELKFKKGAEIGVGTGVYSEILSKSNPKLTLYCIDPWRAYEGYKERTTQKSMNQIYKAAKERLKNYHCKLIRDFSERAYKNFFNSSLDFVYIDGNHDEAHVMYDIVHWSPKVKKGGIIAGSNFARYKGRYGSYNKVKETVIKYANASKINPWFALRAPNEHSSWMWIKT